MVTTNRTCGVTATLLSHLVLVVFMLSYAPAAAAQEGGVIAPQERTLRVYNTRFLHPDNAVALAYQLCGQDGCEVSSMGDQGIMLRAVPQIHAEYEMLLAQRDVPPATQEFRIILLRADQSGSMPEVPADARAALEDLRDMLPYTGFEMIDSGWLRTSRSGSMTLGEAGSFFVQMVFAGDPREDSALLVEGFELVHSRVMWENLDAEDGSEPWSHLGDGRTVLSSQFGINVGETVVVGTSRANGSNEALVVLLTALDR